MDLFGQLVRTVVNVAILPVAVARDIGNSMMGQPSVQHTAEQIEKLKKEASDVG